MARFQCIYTDIIVVAVIAVPIVGLIGFGIAEMSNELSCSNLEWETLLAGLLGLAGGCLAYRGALKPYLRDRQIRVLEFQHKILDLKNVLEPSLLTRSGDILETRDGNPISPKKAPKISEATEALPSPPYDVGDPKLLVLYDNLRIHLPSSGTAMSEQSKQHALKALGEILDHIEQTYPRQS